MEKQSIAESPGALLARQRWKKAKPKEKFAVGKSLSEARWEKWRQDNPEKWAEGEERRKKRAAKKAG